MAKNFFKDIEHRFSLTFWGFVLAIIFGLLSVYSAFIKQNKPSLYYTIIEDYGVFDVKEEVGKLQVFYEGDNLNERKEDLRVITFQVRNDGDASVLQNFYDPNYPLGFKLINGRVVEHPTLTKASSEYLKGQVSINRLDEHSFTFSNVIIDSGGFFEVKLLVLHSITNKPEIQSLGKVAEVDNIYVNALNDSLEERSFINILFGGGFTAFFAKLFVYGVIFFFLLGFYIYAQETISGKMELRGRKRNASTFKDVYLSKISAEDEVFFAEYIDGGVRALQRIQSLVKSRKISLLSKIDPENPDSVTRYGKDLELFQRLKSVGIIKEHEGEVGVREESLAVLMDFISYLERKSPAPTEETIKVFAK